MPCDSCGIRPVCDYAPPRPATRVDNWVIFHGGYSRKLTLRERLAWHFGRRTVR